MIKLTGTIVGSACLMERHCSRLELGADPDMRLAYIKIDDQYQCHSIASAEIMLLEDYSSELWYREISLNVFDNLPHEKNYILD